LSKVWKVINKYEIIYKKRGFGMKKEIILREIRYYSKVYSPNCKKVKELRKRLTKLKKQL